MQLATFITLALSAIPFAFSAESVDSAEASTDSAASADSARPSGSKTKYWFSFGDSYTSSGFVANGAQPNAANPFGNPPYPGNTQCGAYPGWLDYAALTLNTTSVMVYNYAASGATVDNNLTSYSQAIPSVTQQAGMFLQYHAPGKSLFPGWKADNTLFSIWIGINDIGTTFYNQGEDAFLDILLDRYFNVVNSLYDAGARNFLFVQIPPMYRTPLFVGAYPEDQRILEKDVINSFNAKLAAKVSSFTNKKRSTTTQIWDPTPIFNTVLDNPTAYGFVDPFSFGTEDQYAWCDFYHPGSVFHHEIAKNVSTILRGRYI